MSSIAKATKKRKSSKGEGNSVSRAPNSFLLFSNEKRPILQSQNPSLNNSEISKLLGQSWRELHPDKKNIYREKAEAIRKEMEAKNEELKRSKLNSGQSSPTMTSPSISNNTSPASSNATSPILSQECAFSELMTPMVPEFTFEALPFEMSYGLFDPSTLELLAALNETNVSLSQLVSFNIPEQPPKNDTDS